MKAEKRQQLKKDLVVWWVNKLANADYDDLIYIIEDGFKGIESYTDVELLNEYEFFHELIKEELEGVRKKLALAGFE